MKKNFVFGGLLSDLIAAIRYFYLCRVGNKVFSKATGKRDIFARRGAEFWAPCPVRRRSPREEEENGGKDIL